MPYRSAVDRYKNVFALGSANKAHMVAEPAFKPAALIVVGTRAFLPVIIAALEPVNVEIAHIRSDFFKVFYKLAV